MGSPTPTTWPTLGDSRAHAGATPGDLSANCSFFRFFLNECVVVSHLNVWLCTVCVQCPAEARRGRRVSWDWSYELPCGCCGWHPDPLGEQPLSARSLSLALSLNLSLAQKRNQKSQLPMEMSRRHVKIRGFWLRVCFYFSYFFFCVVILRILEDILYVTMLGDRMVIPFLSSEKTKLTWEPLLGQGSCLSHLSFPNNW